MVYAQFSPTNIFGSIRFKPMNYEAECLTALTGRGHTVKKVKTLHQDHIDLLVEAGVEVEINQ